MDRIGAIKNFWATMPKDGPDLRILNAKLLKGDFEILISEVERLTAIEEAAKRLAYVVRRSINSGPLSKDPTQEAAAWRALRLALGEGYDERGNLVKIGEDK